MRTIVSIIFFLLFCACSEKSYTNKVNQPCNEDKAVKTVETYLKRRGLYAEDFVIEATDSSDVILVSALPGDVNRIGGGGKFKVSKENCIITEVQLYQ